MSEAGVVPEGFVLPAGTVTLLLADLEGSVKAWEADSDAMEAAIREIDALVTDSVGRHDGVRPIEQGEGDSFVAAFSRASDALAAAVEIQAALADGSPQFRMALHTGEAQKRDEGNYIGGTINRAARLRDLAHGGQVLLSQTTRDLVADKLPDGGDLVDLGTHRLKDLARPEHVWQLSHPDLRSEFPPLESLDETPNNLPVQLTDFIGREVELEAVTRLLVSSRLLTLTGSGGCGKTRLALQAAADVARRFRDGVWFVDLSTASAGEQVEQAIGMATGATGDDVAGHLRKKDALVILDNCEQVIAAVAETADRLLRGATGLTILATSRERIDVPGEVTWRVPSLALPAAGANTTVEALAAFDAIKLFVDRAGKSRPGFAVTNDNVADVVKICSRLDGIPLAIELAAARVRVLSPNRIAAGLDDRFHLLTGGARTVMPRQQTLQASVDWSHDLLSPDEQTVFRRLAVFLGGWDLTAAEHICASDGVDEWRVFDLLCQLVDKSLVVLEEEREHPRYSMLETVRQYGLERLRQSGEENEVRLKHARWALSLIRLGENETGLDEGAAMQRFKQDRANLDLAMEWSLTSGPKELAVELAGTLASFLFFDGRTAASQDWLERALTDHGLDPSSALLRAVVWASHMGRLNRDRDTAMSRAEEALALAEEVATDFARERAREAMLWAASTFGEHGRVEISQEIDTSDRRKLLGEAYALWYSGRWREARPRFQAIIDTEVADESRSNRWATGWAITNLWAALWQREGIASALDAQRRARLIGEEIDDVNLQSTATAYESMLLMHAGALEEARTAISALEALQGDASTGWGVAGRRAHVAMIEGDLESAHALLAEEPGKWYRPLTAVRMRSRGDLEAARKALDDLFDDNNSFAPGWRPGEYAVQALAEGDLEEAERLAHLALDQYAETGQLYGQALQLETLAAVHAEAHAEQAARMWLAAGAVREQLGSRRFPWEEWTRDPLPDVEPISVDDAVGLARRMRDERPARPATGWKALTPTELDVTRLVAEHLTNPEIAERLFMSRHTVKTHLARVFTKLGVRSRSQLAELARDHLT